MIDNAICLCYNIYVTKYLVISVCRKENDMALIWIEIIVAAVIFEGLISKRVFMWFVPAAIIASIMWFCKVETYWQIVVFLLVSALGILWAKLFLPKIMRTMPDRRTNIDAIIGEKCVVTEKIDNVAGCGQAKVKGQIWSARGVQPDDTFAEGELLTIVAIEGVKLICKKSVAAKKSKK